MRLRCTCPEISRFLQAFLLRDEYHVQLLSRAYGVWGGVEGGEEGDMAGGKDFPDASEDMGVRTMVEPAQGTGPDEAPVQPHLSLAIIFPQPS